MAYFKIIEEPQTCPLCQAPMVFSEYEFHHYQNKGCPLNNYVIHSAVDLERWNRLPHLGYLLDTLQRVQSLADAFQPRRRSAAHRTIQEISDLVKEELDKHR